MSMFHAAQATSGRKIIVKKWLGSNESLDFIMGACYLVAGVLYSWASYLLWIASDPDPVYRIEVFVDRMPLPDIAGNVTLIGA